MANFKLGSKWEECCNHYEVCIRGNVIPIAKARVLYPLNYGDTHRKQDHFLGSHVWHVSLILLRSISNVKCAPCSDKKNGKFCRIRRMLKWLSYHEHWGVLHQKSISKKEVKKSNSPWVRLQISPIFCWSRTQAVVEKAWSKSKEREWDRSLRTVTRFLPWKTYFFFYS